MSTEKHGFAVDDDDKIWCSRRARRRKGGKEFKPASGGQEMKNKLKAGQTAVVRVGSQIPPNILIWKSLFSTCVIWRLSNSSPFQV